MIIQIALGIILAVVILRYWIEIISFGIKAFILAMILAAVAAGGYFAYLHYESVLIFVILAILFCFFGFVFGKIDDFIFKKCHLTLVEVLGALVVLAMTLMFLWFSIDAIPDQYGFSLFSFIVFSLGCAVLAYYIKSAKETIKDRKSNPKTTNNI